MAHNDQLQTEKDPEGGQKVRKTSSNSAYYKGCTEAQERTFKLNEVRAELTAPSAFYVVVMVGLPGRGKSFIARKVENFLNWRGIKTRVFNVGRYRREGLVRDVSLSGKSSFFAPTNTSANEAREKAANEALEDMFRFFEEQGGQAAVYDATNTTDKRREWLNTQCTQRGAACLFVESICEDTEVLEENFKNKVRSSPDFEGMDLEVALEDFRARVVQYESVYETISNDTLTYIKLYNLSSKMLCNRVFGSISMSLLPFLLAITLADKPVWLCRAGSSNTGTLLGEGTYLTNECKAAALNEEGHQLSFELARFVHKSCQQFEDIHEEGMGAVPTQDDSSNKLGQSPPAWVPGLGPCSAQNVSSSSVIDSQGRFSEEATCKVMISTLPRAKATVSQIEGGVEEYSSLNPLDKGVCEGLSADDIQTQHAEWVKEWQKDKFNTRFPGGESYADVLRRLENVVIEFEQQTAPVLICTEGVAVIQLLYCYLSGTPVTHAPSIAIPRNSVIQFSPLMGGGWKEEIKSLHGGVVPVASIGVLPNL